MDDVFNFKSSQRTIDTYEDIDEFNKLHKQQFEEEQLALLKENRKHREKLIQWCKWLATIYLSIILLIVFFLGFELIKLSDWVMIAVLTTTTANILGLMYIILKGLFKS